MDQDDDRPAEVELEMVEDEENSFRIKRVMSALKEEYFIDGKSVSQLEYRSFLESKKLSQTNSFFIIPQSKIIEVSNQTDEKRYDLLKDICGAKSYEEKKNEGIKEIYKSDKSLEDIKKTLENLEIQQEKLSGEKEVFEGYTKENNKLRGLQYRLYKKKYDKANKKSKKINDEIARVKKSLEGDLNELREIEDQKNEISKRNNQNNEDIKSYNEKIESNEKLIKKTNEKIKRCNEEISKIEPDLENEKIQKDVLREQLEKIKKEKGENEKEIEKLQTEYDTIKHKFDEISNERKEYENRKQIIEAKLRRCKYNTVDERNKSLDNEIKESFEHIKYNDGIKKEKIEMRTALNQKNEECIEEINAIEAMNINREIDELEKINIEIARKIEEKTREKTHNEREKENKNRSLYETEKLYKSSYNNYNSLNRNTLDSINYLNNYCSNKNEFKDKYFGPIISLISLKNIKVSTAVEKTAGKMLFNCVVDSLNTAVILSKVLRNNNKGTITFIPLNQVEVKQPIKLSEDKIRCSLVKELLIYNEMFENAIRYIFGNTIFCTKYDEGLLLKDKYRNNVVMIDGIEIKAKGEITGGYINEERMVLKNYILMNTKREEMETLKKDFENISEKCNQIEVEMREYENQKNINISIKNNKKAEMNKIMNRKCVCGDIIKKNSQQIEEIDKDIQSIDNIIRENEIKIEEFKEEKRKPFINELSESEKEELNKCHYYLTYSYSNYMNNKNKFNEIETELINKKLLLSDLEQQQEMINIQIATFIDSRRSSLSGNNNNNNIVEKITRCEKLKNSIEIYNKRIEEYNENINNLKQRRRECINNQEKYKDEEEAKNQEYEMKNQLCTNEKINLDKLESQAEVYRSSSYSSMVAIRDLGSLPSQQQQQSNNNNNNNNNNKRTEELENEIQTLKETIEREYSKINQKSIQQYEQIKKTYDEFRSKYEILKKEKNDIEEYIKTIDRKEKDIIETTFEKFNQSFKEIFKQINPHGNAELNKLYDNNNNNSNNINEREIKGISINVSFDRKSKNQIISHLSGGQKTVVSIAFLFALQKISESPFYLFDEIDDALDDKNREIVSTIIGNTKKNNIQFIVTSFKEEMLNVGDKYIKVEAVAQKSEVREISKTDATNFFNEMENARENRVNRTP